MKPFKKIIPGFAIIFLFYNSFAQGVPYGNNPAAGHYIDIAGTKIYYEIYARANLW